MSTDNIDNLFKRLRELKDEKEFHINEEIVEYLLHKKLSKLNVKILVIKQSLINKGYNV